ncbi:hypothetical protein EV361DRAFT_938411 [Lentinula raphanica]|nr:hypothetical protein EV361DRAFT_938411 [Lentinula raphanica]
MANPSRPEPMNATTHHSKVNVSLTLAEPYFVGGDYISGKMEMDCKADKGLGIGVIMIELFATQELTSRDHSARSTFIHAKRLFQGPGLPPSNAVQAHPLPGDLPLPLHYHQAKRGHSTFLFRLPLPATSPSSISFGSGLASVNYEIRASVGVYWKGERQLVTSKKDADVVEAYDAERIGQEEPEVTVVGENGKIWCQARLIGGVLIAGESACIELQVKNHSAKKNTGLSISLNRSLHLPNVPTDEQPLQISDTVTTIPFRGPEYTIPPGVEGVASLVFDVPKRTKGVRGGTLLGDESEALGKHGKSPRTTQGLFEINCTIAVKMTMGFGNKDILIEIPAVVVHPSALPELPLSEQHPEYPYYDQQLQQQTYQPVAQVPYITQSPSTTPFPSQSPYPLDPSQAQAAYAPYNALPMSPGPPQAPMLTTSPYVDPTQNLVWLPPPIPFGPSTSPQPYQQPYLYSPPPPLNSHTPYAMAMNQETAMPYTSPYGPAFVPSPPRASSTGPFSPSITTTTAALLSPPLPGLPPPSNQGLTSMFASHLVPNQSQQMEFSPTHEASGPEHEPRRYGGDLGLGAAPVQTDVNGEEGTGQRASRIAQTLRVTSQAKGRGRSASPIGGRRYPLKSTSEGVVNTTTTPATTRTSPSLALAPLSPLDLNFKTNTLPTPLHSPRPVLSPKRSFTKVTEVSNGGGVISKSVPKSERVEDLERMADEVGTMTKDLSADLPRPVSAGDDDRGRRDDVDEPPPVPSMSDKARLLPSRARVNDYFSIVPAPNKSALASTSPTDKSRTKGHITIPSSSSANHNTRRHRSHSPSHPHTHLRPRSRSRTPPTPATPTLTAVATPRKSMANGYIPGYSSKAVKAMNTKGKDVTDRNLERTLGVEGRVESGLDVLERKLLAEVGTRKVVDEKRPNVWSVLGSREGKPLSPADASSPGSAPGSGVGADKTEKPSPIEIPRRDSDRDPLNDSAISSLTLPDCGDIGPAFVNTRDALKSADLEERIQAVGIAELDKDRDSDEKTHKGGSGSKKSKKKKHSSRGTLKDGQEGKGDEEENERREERKKDKRNGKKKGKDRTTASKGRVTAWLGGVEAEPPLDDVISPSPSPRPSRKSDLPPDLTTAQNTRPDSPNIIGNDLEESSKNADNTDNADNADTSHIPDPRSSGFVPIGTLKRDIYQRTLVPKDSPMASTNPSEDAKRITDIWNHRDTVKNTGVDPSPRLNRDIEKNPWQSVVGKGRLPVFPLKPSEPEVKYDVRSARGGRGGRVTAVAAIWASGAAGSNTKPTAPSPLSPSNKVSQPAPAKKMVSPFSVPKLPVSVSSSSSSTSGDGNGRVTKRPRSNAGVGVKVASAPVPAVISSSHAKPTLSTTASLARPTATVVSGARKPSPLNSLNVPPTISEFPADVRIGNNKTSTSASHGKAEKTGLGLGAGKAANNLRAVTNSGTRSTNTSTAVEHLAFGQARLRDLIKKYQG